MVQLIESWSETPAFVEGRYTDVLAVNPLALSLAPFYAVGTNLVRATFLDPRVRDMYSDWEAITESASAALRALAGNEVDDPQLNELVGELSLRSERFRRLWARHDVRPKRSGRVRLEHPQVGPIELLRRGRGRRRARGGQRHSPWDPRSAARSPWARMAS